MEKKNAFTITRARPEDAAALLDYLKIVGGETDNLSFGAEGVPLAPEEEQAYLRTQVDSPDHVQYLARVDGELIGTASLNRKPGRMRHRGVFGISLKRARCGLGPDGGRPCLCAGKRLCPARYRGAQRQCPRHPAV